MRRVIFNQKGGVGKSTITCNLAAISANKGKKTLVIDLDIQCNTTYYLLGEKIAEADNTLAHFFKACLNTGFFGSYQGNGLADLIHATPYENLFILPAHAKLEALQDRLQSKYKIFKLREALDKLEGFDNIYIDTPPILNFYSHSALVAADKCLIPFDCDAFSRESLYNLLQTVGEVKADHNGSLEIEGVIVNQFQSQANLPKQLVEELISEGHPVLNARISPSVKVRESHSAAKPLIYFAPSHKITQEYIALHQEINS